MSAFEIWTDGGCHGNPGPGGWAYLIVRVEADGAQRVIAERYGAEKNTTNNRMELCAVIAALETMRGGLGAEPPGGGAAEDQTQGGTPEFGLERGGRSPPCPLTVITDSEYVKNGITVWIHDWKARGWKTAAKKPVKNQDLWMRLDQLAASLPLRWRWVRGHSGHALNERCDELTQKAIASLA